MYDEIEKLQKKVKEAVNNYNNNYIDGDSMPNDLLDDADKVIKAQNILINALTKEIESNGEFLLKKKMAQGFNISVECKGLGRTYEMSFEAGAYKVGSDIKERPFQYTHYHGVGNTFSELLNNMFDKEK